MKIEYPKEKLTAFFIKEKEKIFSAAIIMIAVIIAIVIYNNQAKKLKALNIRKDAQIKRNAVLNDIKQLEKRFESYKNLLDIKDPNSITEAIKNIAKEANVKISSIKMEAQEKQPLYISYPFVLTITAESYHAIGKFISRIENYPGVYSVDTINIVNQTINKEPSQAQQPADKLTVSLTFTVIAFTG